MIHPMDLCICFFSLVAYHVWQVYPDASSLEEFPDSSVFVSSGCIVCWPKGVASLSFQTIKGGRHKFCGDMLWQLSWGENHMK